MIDDIVCADGQITFGDGVVSPGKGDDVVAVGKRTDGDFVIINGIAAFPGQTSGQFIITDQTGNLISESFFGISVNLGYRIGRNGDPFGKDFSCGIEGYCIGIECVSIIQTDQSAESRIADFGNVGAVKLRAIPTQFNRFAIYSDGNNGIMHIGTAVIFLFRDSVTEPRRIDSHSEQLLREIIGSDTGRGQGGIDGIIVFVPGKQQIGFIGIALETVYCCTGRVG